MEAIKPAIKKEEGGLRDLNRKVRNAGVKEISQACYFQ
jgi:hypothetical protein